MRDDIPEAAFRLLTALPVRTHESKVPPVLKMASPRGPSLKPNGKRIAYKGQIFDSHTKAMKELRIGHGRLMRLFATNVASYVD